MNSTLLVIIFLSLAGVIGDFFIKLAGNGPKFMEVRWFVLGTFIYASTAFGWFYALKHLKLSSLGALYGVFTILFLLLVSIFYFHEKLNIREIIGIGSAIVAIILLNRFA